MTRLKRLLWALAEWPVALLLFAYTRLVLATSRLTLAPALERRGVVFVIWHRHLPLVISACGRQGAAIMMSGAPYMAPVARWARLCGLQLVRGASGERGRAALEELATKLRQGQSVLLAVDGPAGPPLVLKPGCVDLALATGAPIVVLASRGRGTFVVPRRWDRLLAARPFARLEVVAAPPIDPRGRDRATLLEAVQAALGSLESTASERIAGASDAS